MQNLKHAKFMQQNRNEVSQIVDHRMMEITISGRQIRVMHLQIEWSGGDADGDDQNFNHEKFTWEPLSRINRDVPEIV